MSNKCFSFHSISSSSLVESRIYMERFIGFAALSKEEEGGGGGEPSSLGTRSKRGERKGEGKNRLKPWQELCAL